MPKRRGGKKKTGDIYNRFPTLDKGQFIGLVEKNNGTKWSVIQIYPEKDEEKIYSASFKPRWPRINKGTYVIIEVATSQTHGYDAGALIVGIFDNAGVADMRKKGIFGKDDEHNGIIFETYNNIENEKVNQKAKTWDEDEIDIENI